MDCASASVDFYDNVIAQNKGSGVWGLGYLDEWFVVNKGLYIYFVAIFMTVWAVLIPTTKMAWKVFKGLSEPPADLSQALIIQKIFNKGIKSSW